MHPNFRGENGEKKSVLETMSKLIIASTKEHNTASHKKSINKETTEKQKNSANI